VQSCATTTDPQHRAICASTAAGVSYVVAAGNDGWDFDYAAQPDTPAVYPEALTVTAMADTDGESGASGGTPICRAYEADDRYASFSNYAATAVASAHTIAAPGVCIRSTVPGGAYGTMSGTSMASPHVAGAVALCLDEGGEAGPCAGLSPAQIVDKMRADGGSRTAASGGSSFAGDPGRPEPGAYFGHLTWVPPADAEPPAVTAVSPAGGATGVATTTGVSVAFNEPMDRAATEAAFSLVRSSDGARVPGSFSWSTNKMTFRPAAALSQGAGHTARLSTFTRDSAGNRLAAARSWSFKTLATVTARPSATVIQSGALRGGDYARLAADDNSVFAVNSTKTRTRVSSWYGRFTNVDNALRSLRLSYRGNSSAKCTQTVAAYRWTTRTWVALDSRAVGATEVQVVKTPTGTLADYVSGATGAGEIRLRARCTRTASAFHTRGDLMQAVYTRP
jgi:subtilisin family serine protease